MFARQVIALHVLSALPIMFCPSTVARFSDEELLHIGSESEKRKNKRTELLSLVKGFCNSLIHLQSSV